MKNIVKFTIISLIAYLFLYVSFSFATNIDSTNKWAWGTDIGWVNFRPINGNITVSDTQLTGRAWSNNYGWIDMQPTNGGVDNSIEGLNGVGTCRGNLSGYAWNTNLGWINFDNVFINDQGFFQGTATGVLAGNISMSGSLHAVQTDWLPDCVPPSNPTVVSLSPNPAMSGDPVTLSISDIEPGATVTVPGTICTPSPATISGIVDCTATATGGLLDGTGVANIITVTDSVGNQNTNISSPILVVDDTAPNTPTLVSTLPNPANDGTTVATTLQGVEEGSTIAILGMNCNPNPADSSGDVVCTGVVGTGGLDGANNTVTITDLAGNTNTSLDTGLVVDNTPPTDLTVVSLSPNPTQSGQTVTLNLSDIEPGATVSIPGLSCTPNPITGSGTTLCTATATGGLLDGSGVTNIITVTDPAGNENTSVSSPVLVIDDTPPSTPTLVSTSPNPAKDGDTTVVTLDDVEPGSTVEIVGMTCSPNPSPASGEVVCEGIIGEQGLDGTNNTVTVTDSVGNINTSLDTGLVVDNTPPVITILGDNPLTIAVGSIYTDQGAIANDDVDGDITVEIRSLNPVDTSAVGVYEVVYAVVDSAGNITQATRIVNVVLGNPPILNLIGDANIQIIQNTSYVDQGATATDLEDGDITSAITNSGAIDTSILGIQTLQYDVIDTSGNNAVPVSREVQVIFSITDFDGDGLDNDIEQQLGTDPSKDDTDNDGTNDNNNDLDNVSPLIELGANNAGDGNNDGVIDAIQSAVSSLPNIENTQYNTLEVENTGSCNQINFFASKRESNLAVQDGQFDYDFGLWDFEIQCGAPGSTADIQIYLDTTYDTSDWIYRKYNERTQTYTDISSIVAYTTETVGTTPVTVINYSITDGGIYDEDGIANGTIIDPSGPSTPTPIVSTGGGTSPRVCRDPEASNYERFGRADNSLCVYEQNTVQEEQSGDISNESVDQIPESPSESSTPDTSSLEAGDQVEALTIPDQEDGERIIITAPPARSLSNTFDICPITRDIQNPNYVYSEGVFSDENKSVYREEILKFAQIGIVDGYDDGMFKPLQQMTRTEFLKVALISHCYVYRNEDPSSLLYTDVDKSSWQARVIKKAEDLGMINGDQTENGIPIFRPDDIITKAEAIKILMNISKIQALEPQSIKYRDIIVDWHIPYIEHGEALELFDATADNNLFNPDSGVKREDMVDLIQRLVELYK